MVEGPLPILRGRARQAARTSGFVVLTASMLGPFLARMRTAKDDERSDVRDAWVKAWARALLRLFAIDVVVDGALPPRSVRGRLVVSNHRSAIDIGVLLSTFGGSMVSRADLADWPLVGAAARAAGTLFVDRANPKSGAQILRVIERHLGRGQTILLFPEGTTFEGDQVRPFFGGAFVAAARAEAEVLPVGVAYPRASGAAFIGETFPQHLARMAKSDGARMALAVGAPLVLTKGDRAHAITARAQAEVTLLVERARQICGA